MVSGISVNLKQACSEKQLSLEVISPDTDICPALGSPLVGEQPRIQRSTNN